MQLNHKDDNGSYIVISENDKAMLLKKINELEDVNLCIVCIGHGTCHADI